MKTKNLTISYNPSSVGEIFPIYAVNPNAKSAVVEGIYIANFELGVTLRCTVARIDYIARYAKSTTYWGDGSVKFEIFSYADDAYKIILNNVSIPPGTGLSVLDNLLYLKPKDVITLRPNSDGSATAFRPTVTVIETFADDDDASTVVDLNEVHLQLLAGTY